MKKIKIIVNLYDGEGDYNAFASLERTFNTETSTIEFMVDNSEDMIKSLVEVSKVEKSKIVYKTTDEVIPEN